MTGKKIVILLFLSVLTFFCWSQEFSRGEYIQKYQLLAISEMNRSGVPASIKMAQACLESRDGNSEMARNSNNHFGIKCKSGWDGPVSYYDDDERNECFRKYKSVEDSYIDHTNFLLSNTRYNLLFQLSSADYAGWARGLKKAGYATDPSYDKKVIEIIELFQLWKLDHEMTIEEKAQLEKERISNGFNENLVINPYSSRQIILRNGIKSVTFQNGDTFEILTQEFGLKDWELRKFNDFPADYQPKPDEIIYLQMKKTKAHGMYKFHLLAAGESMHYVSQYYGIRLKSLYRKNGLYFAQPVAVGKILNLQKKVKLISSGRYSPPTRQTKN
jgi:hypothetical protein